MNKVLLVLICAIFPLFLLSQSGSEEERTYHIIKAEGKITIDGSADEPDWEFAEISGDFFQMFPFDTSLSVTKTQVRMTYDDQNIYLFAECFDDGSGKYIVQSLRRDWSYPKSDAFVLYLDPFNDKTNGFAFGVNPLGAQREGLLQNGGSFGVTTDWDNRWFSKVKKYSDKWTVEMAIPFKTLRYKKNEAVWRVNFSRQDLKTRENTVWSSVPRNFNVATLAFTGLLIWDEAPPSAGVNISIIPYVSSGYSADYQNNEQSFKPNAGFDAKIAVTSSMNLDLTVNPDFSNVEVDRQVTNLSRFSLFFPERRQFFIENSDLFSRFGFSQIRPFFSRRIGLYEGAKVPILAGARLSGKLNNNWRLGVMDIQTEGVGSLDLRSQNYAVAAIQRQVFNRSNIGVMFVNRQGFNGDSKPDPDDFNRIAIMEYNLASKNNRWQGKAFYQYAFDPNSNREKSSNAVWLMYNDPKWTFMYNHEWVARNFNAEVGFIPRTGYLRFEPSITRRFYPGKGIINNHGPEVYVSNYFDNKSLKLIENQLRLGYKIKFQNLSEFSVNAEDWFIYLTFPFDPTRSGFEPLPDSTGYRWRNISATFTSDFRKRFSYSLYGTAGGYYNGSIAKFGGEINFRQQPWGQFSVAFEENIIALKDTTVALTLISPRFDISFSKNLFFTTFFQFNTQTQNFNINARFQWRFKPMSDLFIVLTDNYGTVPFGVKNRAIVLKLNYWLTL